MRIIGVLAGFVMLLGVTAVAIAGPQRMLQPEWFGFEEIGHNVFAPPAMGQEARDDALDIVALGEDRVAAYFGQTFRRPLIVLCPGDLCDDVFGETPVRGVAYGKRVVRLGEGGLNVEIAAHELSHTAVKEMIGEWRALTGALPAWFDEGLAVIVSRDLRFEGAVTPDVLADLEARPGWWQWGDLVNAHGWRAAYTGARYKVGEIEERIGQEGLLALMDAIADGATFDTALEGALSD